MFILLGDSILNNNAYVSQGKSISDLLIERTSGKTVSLAIDDSQIQYIYRQINNIPNTQNKITTIFLSVGGNDLLSTLTNKSMMILSTIFASYKTLVKSIKINQPSANIVLLDIYYPNNLHFKQYHLIIKECNELLYKYASENNYSVFKISNILTQPTDFTHEIEPSLLGGQKMIESILHSY
jgi:hypothetical protein